MIDIDLVYLWVDGNDPAWIAKHNDFQCRKTEVSPIDCEGRYADNDELIYSCKRPKMMSCPKE